jgi:ribosome biogenesis GTPase A
MPTYPHHMRRAEEELRRLAPLLALALEVRDGRAPYRTAARGLDRILPGVARAVVFTHRDQAFLPRLEEALAAVRPSLAVDARRPDRRLDRFVRGLLPEGGAPPRLVVVGVPNVGKSSVLNRLIGRRRAPTGRRPGITRGPQWISGPGFDVLDTPGLLAVRPDPVLALLGVVPRQGVDPVAMAQALWVRAANPLMRRYGVAAADLTAFLEALARREHLVGKGGVPDLERAAGLLVRAFDEGRLPPVDFEAAPEG